MNITLRIGSYYLVKYETWYYIVRLNSWFEQNRYEVLKEAHSYCWFAMDGKIAASDLAIPTEQIDFLIELDFVV